MMEVAAASEQAASEEVTATVNEFSDMVQQNG